IVHDVFIVHAQHEVLVPDLIGFLTSSVQTLKMVLVSEPIFRWWYAVGQAKDNSLLNRSSHRSPKGFGTLTPIPLIDCESQVPQQARIDQHFPLKRVEGIKSSMLTTSSKVDLYPTRLAYWRLRQDRESTLSPSTSIIHDSIDIGQVAEVAKRGQHLGLSVIDVS
ncbi:hypothetical protein SCLCIDRAFT_12377, partial [Scleroderma citrinum Foug A]